MPAESTSVWSFSVAIYEKMTTKKNQEPTAAESGSQELGRNKNQDDFSLLIFSFLNLVSYFLILFLSCPVAKQEG